MKRLVVLTIAMAFLFAGIIWWQQIRYSHRENAVVAQFAAERKAAKLAKKTEEDQLSKILTSTINLRALYEETNEKYHKALADADLRGAAALNFERMRLTRACAARGSGPAKSALATGQAVSGDHDYPKSSDRPGAEADLAAIRRDEYDALTDNTKRLVEVREWALREIAAGRAKAEE